jgi:hypothetical protein
MPRDVVTPKENELLPNVVVVWPGPEVNVWGLEAGSEKRGVPSLLEGEGTVEIAQHGPATKSAAANTGALTNENPRDMGTTSLPRTLHRALRKRA